MTNVFKLSGAIPMLNGAAITTGVASGGGATLVFGYPTGFAAGGVYGGTIVVHNSTALSGSSIILVADSPKHDTAGLAYHLKIPTGTFTAQFSFSWSQLGSTPSSSGIAFCISNIVTPPGQVGATGVVYTGDANMAGYSAAINQWPPFDSIGVLFSADPGYGSVVTYPSGLLPAHTGLNFNGGPMVQSGQTLGQTPFNDLIPYGINFYSGDTFAVTIVYDGSLLTMVILDTTTNAQARVAWPLNLANTTDGDSHYVGITCGTAATGECAIQSLSYWSGYNTRLSTPTFSPSPGQYSGTQSVTISGPVGATIYYTTNGLLPTSSSTQYTGAISVPANAVIQAVAIQPGFTDSLVGTGVYKINTANTINFASFAAGNLIPVGYAYLSGSEYRISDTTSNTAGALWFPAPVNIQGTPGSPWTTAFTLDFGGGNGQGCCFVIQNNTPAYAGLVGVQITGSAGQISFNAASTPLSPASTGTFITVAGSLPAYPAAGSIQGYSSSTQYLVTSVSGNTATIQTPTNTLPPYTGSTVNTVAGTPSGTWSVNAPSWSGGPLVVAAANRALGYGGLDSVNQGTNLAALGILNSVAVAFDQTTVANSIGVYTGGNQPFGNQVATGLSFGSGGTWNVTLSYDGTNLTVTMQKTTGGTIFSHQYAVNIVSAVGGTTAYVGFTGASGDHVSVQAVTAWTGF
jgi:Chitobiase/beta-hexosaminidase C-terminal domain/Legume lectin domain